MDIALLQARLSHMGEHHISILDLIAFAGSFGAGLHIRGGEIRVTARADLAIGAQVASLDSQN